MRIHLREMAKQLDELAKQDVVNIVGASKAVRAPSLERLNEEHGPQLSRIAKRLYKIRRLRARYLRGDFFAEPAWDMLLDLYIAKVEGKRISVTSLSLASDVPSTTALRYIALLVEQGLAKSQQSLKDRRVRYIELTDLAANQLSAYLQDVGEIRISANEV